jgi:hypothetical protein
MFTYKKVGGIHFCRVFTLGFSFFITRKHLARERVATVVERPSIRVASVRLADGRHVLVQV